MSTVEERANRSSHRIEPEVDGTAVARDSSDGGSPEIQNPCQTNVIAVCYHPHRLTMAVLIG